MANLATDRSPANTGSEHISDHNASHGYVNDLDKNTTKGDILMHNGAAYVALGVGTDGYLLKAASGEAAGAEWAAETANPGDKLTTKGDTLIHNGAIYVREAVGSNDQVLTADSAQASGVKWAAVAGASSPVTTKGDVYTFDSSDARLAVGTNDHVLTADSGETTGLKWAAVAEPTTPVTTKGDVYTYDSDDARLAVGTNDHVLTADSGEATGLKWAAVAGASSPVTTKGDIYTYDSSDARLPVGTNDHVLTADSGESLGVKWAAPAASAGGLEVDELSSNTILSSSGVYVIDTTSGNITITLPILSGTPAAGYRIQVIREGDNLVYVAPNAADDYWDTTTQRTLFDDYSAVSVAAGASSTSWLELGRWRTVT